MTCIIGLEHKGKAYIGADSLGSDGWRKATYDTPKLFKKYGMVFGYTTSYRFGQIIQHHMREIITKNNTSYDYLVAHIVPEIRRCLKEHGAAKIKDSVDFGGNCIIGLAGKIYELQNDFSIIKPTNGISCVGSGEQVAMGAVLALDKMRPEARIKKALSITSDSIASVGGTFTVMGVD